MRRVSELAQHGGYGGFTRAQLLRLLDMQRDGGWRDKRAAVPRTIAEVHSEAAAEKAAAEEATHAALRNDGRGQRHGGDRGRAGPWNRGGQLNGSHAGAERTPTALPPPPPACALSPPPTRSFTAIDAAVRDRLRRGPSTAGRPGGLVLGRSVASECKVTGVAARP
jgi:hypothetical protein